MDIRINRFFFLHDLLCRNRVFFNRRRYIQIIRTFLYILFMINEFIFFINKIKAIKYHFIHNRRFKFKFKNNFNQIHLF